MLGIIFGDDHKDDDNGNYINPNGDLIDDDYKDNDNNDSDIGEFKLHVSGNGKWQVRTFVANFVEHFRFIISFLRRKNNYVFQF